MIVQLGLSVWYMECLTNRVFFQYKQDDTIHLHNHICAELIQFIVC